MSSGPTSSAITPPSARNGPNGTATFRAPVPWLSITPAAHQGPGQHRDQQCRGHGTPEIQPHHRGELHVAHPHAARVGQGEEEQQSAGRGGRDSAVREARGIGGHHHRESCDRPGQQDHVGDHPSLEIGQGDRGEDRDEEQSKGELGRVVPEDDRGGGERNADRELDKRVSGGDRRLAATAVTAEQQPGEDRHVVVCRDLRAA